ncbi:SCO family protein [Glaciimonas sp. PAMC28666]|nr:SCO family protein [Glaciimonas sp. PAMC28666]
MKRIAVMLPRIGSTIAASLIVVVMGLSVAACGDKQASTASNSQEMTLSPQSSKFINTDVTGLGYARDFALTDHTGKPRTLADFKGKVVVVFFGYTQCPDVCPTTMAEMSSAMKELGPLADKVQVLFVTVDPERDTQALLAQYVPAFDPRFLGLYGDQAATEKVAKEFRVFYQKVPGKTPGSYSFDHTAGSYVFDPQGHIRLFVRNGQGPDPIAHDLKILLS